MRTPAFALCWCLVAASAPPAVAQDHEDGALSGEGGESPPIRFSTTPPSPTPAAPDAEHPGAADASDAAGPDVEPPRRPRRRGVVLESTLGVLAFAGQFRHVAPPAYWMHAQLGYELSPWFMLFGEGELALTDTSEAQGPSSARAFPMWGMGAGARATVHATERVAGLVQASVGGITAYVPHDALTNLGFRNAESLGLGVGGRIGVEWYQRDPHFALSAQGGARYAQGFARFGA
ncbi:MAG TPA: hypothetical protein VE987_20270, partial [Polyangiaceae bacterium]|nr:hypothetical protein [Polyangiaceae bacterium]